MAEGNMKSGKGNKAGTHIQIFTDDPRYKQAHKEALIGVGLVVFNFLWWFLFAYGLGSAPPEEYTYILGFPAWFFFSCLGSLVVMSILVIFVVKKFFVGVPLDDENDEKDRIKF